MGGVLILIGLFLEFFYGRFYNPYNWLLIYLLLFHLEF